MSQTKVPYVINLFGSAIQSWELVLTPALLLEIERLRSAQHFTIQEIFFDLDLIRKLGVKHWTELGRKVGCSELILNTEARIELRKNGRMAERIQVAELIETTQLFAKYNVETMLSKPFAKEEIIVIEEIKGQVAKFTFDSENFQIQQLQFLLRRDELSTTPRLASIKMNQATLHSSKEDVLLIGQEIKIKI